MKVKAQGKTFTFPDGTSIEDVSAAIDEYFAGQATPVQSSQSIDNAQPIEGVDTQQEQGALSKAWDAVTSTVTGGDRMTPTMESLEPVGNAPELNAMTMDAAKMGFVQLFGGDQAQMAMLQKMGGKMSQDEKGNLIVTFPSGDYAVNKPGLSPQDVTSFIGEAAIQAPAAAAGVVGGLAAGPGGAVAAASTVSAGIEYAKQKAIEEITGIPVNKTDVAVAGILGGAGKAAEELLSTGARLVKGAPSEETAKAVQYAKEHGVDLFTSDVAPPTTYMGKAAETLGERVPIIGTGGARAAQQEKRQDLVTRFAEQFGEYDPTTIVQSAKGKHQAIKSAAGNRLETIKSEMGDAPIDMSGTIAAIDKEIASLETLGKVADKSAIQALNDYKDELLKDPSYELASRLRSQFRQHVKGDSMAPMKDATERAVNNVYRSMTDDLGASIESRLGADKFTKWKDANAIYAEEAMKATKTKIKTVLEKGEVTPELVNSMLYSNKPSEVKRLYESVGSKGRDAMRAGIIDRAMKKADTPDGVSVEKFMNELNRLSDNTGIVFKGENKKQLDGLKTYLDSTRRAAGAAAATKTGQELYGLAGLGALATGVTSVGQAVSLGLAARAYQSAPVRDMMAKLANTPKGSEAADRIVTNITRAITAMAQAADKQEGKGWTPPPPKGVEPESIGEAWPDQPRYAM